MKNKGLLLGIIGFVACLLLVSFASATYVSPALKGLKADTDSVLVTVRVDYQGNVPSQEAFDAVVASIGQDNVKDRFYPEAVVASLSSVDVDRLSTHANVAGLETAPTFSVSMYDAVKITHAVDVWPIVYNGQNLTGVGQTIAIIDTGIDFTHPDLAAKNIAGVGFDCYNFANCAGSPSVTDLNGHGTHVAGIAGASGGISGIAPGVNLIALKMFNGSSSTFSSVVPIERSINKAVALAEQYNISVISMSIASNGWFTGACDANFPTLATAINAAAAKNISVVISTGNNYKTDRISVPSCISSAIPVAASNKDDTLATYSNRNHFVKLVAPGTSINSTKKGGGYTIMSGTSMAAPMVSASIAMINQKLALDGKPMSMAPKQIELLLAENGDVLKDASFKRINLQKVFMKLDVLFKKLSRANADLAITENCDSGLC